MFKPGSIRKIVVRDFVTYSYVEVEPGPNLNMIIGPNGTGKSTIVAAIILGLGGNPKTVGRGTRISEYIKHNCNEASIEITLQTSSDELICINRHFDHSEKTTWFLNGKRVPMKEVESTIKQFNIQVDNLCQFLPQDRVQDFAKMNKQQLLQQTQIAICRHDLIERQLNLIKIRDKHKEFQATIEKSGQKLQELEDANIRIEGKVKNLSRKEKYLKYIEDVDRKIAWMKYENTRSKMDEIKQDKMKATDALNKYKNAAKPIENAITNAKKLITNIQNKITSAGQLVRNHESAVQKKLDAHSSLKSNVGNILGDLNSRIREIDGRNQEIASITQQITTLRQNKEQLIETYGADSQRDEKTNDLNETIRKMSVNVSKIVRKKGDLENNKRNKMYELRGLENELQNLENVKQQRLEWLRRMDKDAFAAVQWLRSNKQMFKGEVFEPMMLELNVLNPNHAIYIENTIPMRDRVAFTCVLKEDMNLLIRMLRDQQKLSVNVVHSGSNLPALDTYQPSLPIEQLKPYGMFAYIRSLVTGPEPIMKYLCKSYHIHNIPVGNHITNQRFDKVPAQITSFFSDKLRYSTSYSRYTGEKSTRQNEIKSDGSLAISVDAQHIENVRGKLNEVQNCCQGYEDQINNLNMQINQLNQTQNSFRENLKELHKSKQDIQGIESRIRVLSNKLEQLHKNKVSKEQIQSEADVKIKRVVQKMVACQNDIKDAFKKYSELLRDSEVDKLSLDTSRKQVAFLENKAQDLRNSCQKAEDTLSAIKEAYAKVTTEAKVLLTKAKQLSNGFTPPEDGFNEFREVYDKLTDNLEELEAEKEHTLSKIDCLNTADVGELEEYQQRKQLISKLQDDVQRANIEFDRTTSDMNKLQEQWLEPLQELISEINMRFSNAFQRMGCAGEVSIFTGNNDKDFAEYGLSIKVKYRDTEPLQELNSVVQSGGERAVATAAYMLSLQELTPVPFRCVDEINQGMDSNNERRIFELLVDATCQEDTSQYFFITPKLVSHLKFVRTMTVHIVHNGPFVSSKEKWNNVIEHAKQAILAH